jgi:hypothetical protein
MIRMFPNGCPPTTLISMNARYDPHFHVRIGAALRPLRKEGYLIIGSGGAVHNLYRNRWEPMLRFRDNFAQETAPESWALEFRQSVEDVVTQNSGPQLRRAVTRLMKHPQYRDAHASDDHFISGMFVAGAVGDKEDEGSYGALKAETWELVGICAAPRLDVANCSGRPICATRNSPSDHGSGPLHEKRTVSQFSIEFLCSCLSDAFVAERLCTKKNFSFIELHCGKPRSLMTPNASGYDKIAPQESSNQHSTEGPD